MDLPRKPPGGKRKGPANKGESKSGKTATIEASAADKNFENGGRKTEKKKRQTRGGASKTRRAQSVNRNYSKGTNEKKKKQPRGIKKISNKLVRQKRENIVKGKKVG